MESRYYLLGPNYSVVGYGNADGSVIERLDFTASGDWVPGGGTAPGFYHDADGDFDIDLPDVASFAACFDPAGGQASPACLAAHDYDDAGLSDGDIDLDDFTALTGCYAGPYVTPGQDCARPSRGRSLPDSGTYALHGRPVDVLSDGLVLVNYRARTYLPQHPGPRKRSQRTCVYGQTRTSVYWLRRIGTEPRPISPRGGACSIFSCFRIRRFHNTRRTSTGSREM